MKATDAAVSRIVVVEDQLAPPTLPRLCAVARSLQLMDARLETGALFGSTLTRVRRCA